MKKHRAFRCACGFVLALVLAFTSLPVSTYAAKSSAQIQSEIDAQKEAKKQQRAEARERLKELQNGKKADFEAETEENLSKKEMNKRKLAEARRRDAEKYGDYPECAQNAESETDKKKK